MKTYQYILVLFILSSCNFINPFHDEGEYIETIIEIEDFTQVEFHNVFNIEIISDTETYILYKGGENILEEMNYTSQNKVLKLDYKFNNWTKNFKNPTLEIHITQIEKIDLYSSVNLISQNQLSGENLAVNIHQESDVYEINLNVKYSSLQFHTLGSVGGTFVVSGTCPKAIYTLNGSTNIKSSELFSEDVTIFHNSLGNAHIYALNKLAVTFYKSGDVYYKGSPEDIEIKYIQINNQNASGKLIPE